MSDHSFQRAMLDWLEDGSDRTPPGAIDAVLVAIQTTPQARGLAAPRRFRLPGSTSLRFAGVAIVASVLIGVALSVAGPRPFVGGPSATPSTSTMPTPDARRLAGRIAFVRESPSSNADIWSMNADGSDVRQLTSMGAPEGNPAWSPDGTRIAFTAGDASASLWVMAADGSNVHMLVDADFAVGSPTWSPDGTRIAYADQQHGGIYVINADGTGIVRLTEPAPGDHPGSQHLGDQGPAWSPQGDRIAFGNGDSIFTVRPDGSNRVRIATFTTSPASHIGRIAWSPDGERIAVGIAGFDDQFDAGADIWLIDNTTRVLLSADRSVQSVASGPSWSPDGSWIAFTGVPEPNLPQLFVIRPDGTGLGRLGGTDVSGSAPDWSKP